MELGTDKMMDYELIDSGSGRKLERFGKFVLDRPALGAIWLPTVKTDNWKADAIFTREGQNNWKGLENIKESWEVVVSDIRFKLMPTDFGHLGIFPEQKNHWTWIQETIRSAKKPFHLLNLFAYSGGVTLAAAKAGAEVCHLDASKGMVSWARENAHLNRLDKAPIRWIIDDVMKFIKREHKRGVRYDAIVLDPPSFGRGAKGEVFKIEETLPDLLGLCQSILVPQPKFVLLSCHTPGLTAIGLHHLVQQMMHGYQGRIETGEMVLEGKKLSLPSGTYARWMSK